MSKYLVKDAKITVKREELLDALDKAGDIVEIEFEPESLANIDKIRIGDTILKGKPDIMSHKVAKFPNFKDDVEFLKGEEIVIGYNKELGSLMLIGDHGRHHITVDEIVEY
jgi:hypothetical protein